MTSRGFWQMPESVADAQRASGNQASRARKRRRSGPRDLEREKEEIAMRIRSVTARHAAMGKK